MDKNDYEDWLNEFYRDLVDDYNKKYSTSFENPEDEDEDLDRWLKFLDEEYQLYCEAWAERAEEHRLETGQF